VNRTKAWIRIAYCHDIPLREGRAVQVGNREIAIFNLGDRFLAVDNRCPHRGGPLADGIVSGTSVVCPLHAWKLSLETGKGVVGASISGCIETFGTRVEGDVVLLQLGDQGRDDPDEIGRQDLSALCGEPDEISRSTTYPCALDA